MDNSRAFINYDQRFDPPDEDLEYPPDDEQPAGTVYNVIELVTAAYGVHHETESQASAMLRKWIYKYTDCGAFCKYTVAHCDNWGDLHPAQIAVGSIIEGVDWGTETHILRFPFTVDQFNDAVDRVEAEAETIWNDTHGCEACGDPNPETGYTPIRPDCPNCHGQGIVI